MRDWTAFEILLVISGLCGVLMVVGAMWLLRRRAITLESAGRDGTLSVELINKLKITTANPVLALFVVGLFLFLVPC